MPFESIKNGCMVTEATVYVLAQFGKKYYQFAIAQCSKTIHKSGIVFVHYIYWIFVA
jgi:hypothetical protein